MALRLKPETLKEWKKWLETREGAPNTWPPEERYCRDWRPVPRAEPAPEKVYDTHTFDIYRQTWVDT